MRHLLILAGLLALTACGSGKTYVEVPARAPQRFAMATVTVVPGTVAVPADVQSLAIAEVQKQLYEEHRFVRGAGLNVELSFVQFQPGDRMKRWFAGFTSWGASSLTARVIYRDPAGNELGRITSEGNITGGLFGGSQNEAVENMAEQIAVYATENFR